MKMLLNYIKQHRLPVPVRVGRFIAKIPYGIRPGIGQMYAQQAKILNQYPNMSSKQKKEYIFRKLYPVFAHAYKNIPFYTLLYKQSGIELEDIRSFDDVSKIP